MNMIWNTLPEPHARPLVCILSMFSPGVLEPKEALLSNSFLRKLSELLLGVRPMESRLAAASCLLLLAHCFPVCMETCGYLEGDQASSCCHRVFSLVTEAGAQNRMQNCMAVRNLLGLVTESKNSKTI